MIQDHIVNLMEKMHSIIDLIEFEPLESLFNDVISHELIEMYNFEAWAKILRLAYEMELPIESFKAAAINFLLLNFQEIPLTGAGSIIEFTYFLTK